MKTSLDTYKMCLDKSVSIVKLFVKQSDFVNYQNKIKDDQLL